MSNLTWSAIAALRKGERLRLRAVRAAVGAEPRRRLAAHVDAIVDELLAAGPPPCLGFYWPIRGEPNLLACMRRAHGRGAVVALPVVTQKDQPLAFRRWTPEVAMVPGVWDIPVPATGDDVDPELLFVPLVGFDDAGYRLGNGGGYYDRTLAARRPRPRTFGVGFACLHLPTIHPQPHDLPMDRIVTEVG